MNSLELLIDFHISAQRQGPGSTKATLRALEAIPLDRNAPLHLADIGCGTGAQTIDLAKNTKWEIDAIDLFPPFLEELRKRSKQAGFAHRIYPRAESMSELSAKPESWDIIWSEGAIYNMGFEPGIRYWHSFLKPNGYLVVSELSWLTPTRPKGIENHWNQEYPYMADIPTKIAQLQDAGYHFLTCFTLPPDDWESNYYKPMEDRFDAFLSRHGHASEAIEIVEAEKHEIALFRRFKESVGYVFYLAQRP